MSINTEGIQGHVVPRAISPMDFSGIRIYVRKRVPQLWEEACSECEVSVYAI